LTGEYGCGKTVISRLVFEFLSRNKYEIAMITNPLMSSLELLYEICCQLGIKPESDKKTRLLEELNDRLYETLKAQKETVIIIDEAQAIRDRMTFEELRMLLNFQLNDRFLLSLILIGQTDLRETLEENKPLKQRLAVRYHINPLNREDTEKYIIHRLTVAGAERKIFANGTVDIIWESSGGIPRLINTICDACLLFGFTLKIKEITRRLAEKAILDMEL